MSSNIDMPLDSLVKTGRGRRGGGRGWTGPKSGQRPKGIGRVSGRGGGVSKSIGAARGGGGITARLGFSTKLKTVQNGVKTKSVQKVSDLRDVLATKSKTVPDLRAKLPPKPSKKFDKTKSSNRQPNDGQSLPLKISSSMFRSTKPRETAASNSRSKEAIFAKDRKSIDKLTQRLPTTSEAKKITVTVQGFSKTTSEAYRKEERLAAVITRQKESRQQNFMKSREEFIASSITSALTGDGRSGGDVTNSRGGVTSSYHKHYRSPSPPPTLPDYPQHYDLPPTVAPPPQLQSSVNMGPLQARGRLGQVGITSVTTLIISNLNDTVSHSDVLELCNAIGPVDNVIMSAPGVAEVTFRYKDDALEAFKKYNQRNLDGMPMMCRLQPGPSRVRSIPLPTHQINSYSRLQDTFLPDSSVYGTHAGNYY